MASAMPARGPDAPMSSNARRVGITLRMRMTAPMVPKSDTNGSGMKYGRDASTRWSRAAMKCPNSCASRMAMRAAVYWAAWTADGSRLSCVTNALATVARNSHTLMCQPVRETGARAGSAGAMAPSSGEGVAEGGGEPLESGGELAIYRSYIGLQPKLAARKRFVCDHLDRAVGETRAGEV